MILNNGIDVTVYGDDDDNNDDEVCSGNNDDVVVVIDDGDSGNTDWVDKSQHIMNIK